MAWSSTLNVRMLVQLRRRDASCLGATQPCKIDFVGEEFHNLLTALLASTSLKSSVHEAMVEIGQDPDLIKSVELMVPLLLAARRSDWHVGFVRNKTVAELLAQFVLTEPNRAAKVLEVEMGPTDAVVKNLALPESAMQVLGLTMADLTEICEALRREIPELAKQ